MTGAVCRAQAQTGLRRCRAYRMGNSFGKNRIVGIDLGQAHTGPRSIPPAILKKPTDPAIEKPAGALTGCNRASAKDFGGI